MATRWPSPGGATATGTSTSRTCATRLRRVASKSFDDPCVCPVFSADGAYLYFARDDHGSECFDIYRYDLADGTLVNLLPDTPTLSPAPDFALSPDGRSLAFAVNHGASCSTAVMAAEPGAAMTYLTDHWFNDWSPRYSPDGALLAFPSETHGQDTAVFVVPAGGGELRAIGGDDMMVARDPAWSPDGRSLAFAGGGGDYEAIGALRPRARARELGLGGRRQRPRPGLVARRPRPGVRGRRRPREHAVAPRPHHGLRRLPRRGGRQPLPARLLARRRRWSSAC